MASVKQTARALFVSAIAAATSGCAGLHLVQFGGDGSRALIAVNPDPRFPPAPRAPLRVPRVYNQCGEAEFLGGVRTTPPGKRAYYDGVGLYATPGCVR